ncbi:MAG TPA: A/G-specific adenine glycosylase [Candidatus Paceibacterota bacterium]
MNANEKAFVKIVYAYYKAEGRHDLAWRQTTDPYKIAVSEVMLQQTQVARVKEKYKEFLKLFPNAKALAAASLADVLKVWTGLGYNRRAKFLKAMAETVLRHYKGKFPKTVSELETLPGVGHYTARAIATFAYNMPDVFIETNIRTVYIHHFFPESFELVDDKVLMPIIEETLDRKNPREWYWALMDYGSFLKTSGVKIHRNSAQYKKQSPLKGSVREVRGAIIKVLASGPHTVSILRKKVQFDTPRYNTAIAQLIAEHLIEKKGNTYQIKS